MQLDKGDGSKNGKRTCVICVKKHCGECLLGAGNCYGCGKEEHKVRDCPMITSRGTEGKKGTPSAPKDDAPTKRRLYALRLEDQSWMRMVIMMRVST